MASLSVSLKSPARSYIAAPPPKRSRTENTEDENYGVLKGLSNELFVKILTFLSPRDLASVSLLNWCFKHLSSNEQLWKFLCASYFPHQPLEQTAQLHYQTCANIKNGRYLVETTSTDFKESGNGTMRFFNGSDITVIQSFWHGDQLVTLSSHLEQPVDSDQESSSDESSENPIPLITIRIWNPDDQGLLHEHLSCRLEEPVARVVDSDSPPEIAWNGQWLAFALISDPQVFLWKKNSEGKLESHSGLDNGDAVTCLRWYGSWLLVGDAYCQVTLWSTDGQVLQTLDCFLDKAEENLIQDIVCRGNQLFISTDAFVSLWEQDEKGTFFKVKDLEILPFCDLSFNKNALFLRSEKETRVLNFTASYQSILAQIANDYIPNSENILLKERFLRMPKRIKQGIFRELDQILIEKGSAVKRFKFAGKDRIVVVDPNLRTACPGCAEDAFHHQNGFTCTPLDINQAIRNYLAKA